MNTQELRRLGVLPYEDAPRRRITVRERPWFTPDGLNFTVTAQRVQTQGRTLRANWTMEQSPEIVNLVSDEMADEITTEIDRVIIREVNERVDTQGIQPNPFDDEDDPWPPNEEVGIPPSPSIGERLVNLFNRNRERRNRERNDDN